MILKSQSKDTDLPEFDCFISCQNVSKAFGDFKALDNINLNVSEGEVIAIVGPSGGGKSTFLRVLNGLESIDAGSIVVNRITLPGSRRDVERIRSEVGMVFQQFNLFEHMTIRENVTFAPQVVRALDRDEADSIAEKLLARVGIADQIDKYPNHLSGGQQQRVAIARALAMNPRAMLFDEPTSALDPEMVAEVLDVIRELADSGMTMLIITHEMGFAKEVSDRMLFMRAGHIEVDASVRDFFAGQYNPELNRFLSKIL